MNFDRLTTFLTAADTLNFTQAARSLSLSQSAVSQQIRELEDDLGLTLFERRGRGLALTPAGDRLRLLATPVMRDLKRARQSLEGLRDLPQGVLSLGASNTLGIYLLPSALGRFSQRYPGVRVSLKVGETGDLLRDLQSGELDLALVEQDPPPGRLSGWEKEALLEDELILIAAPEHPWAGRTIDLETLPEAPYILRTRNSATRQLIADRLAEAGFDHGRLAPRFELGNTEGIKRAVMAGLGIGWVSRYATTLEQAAGLVQEIGVAGLTVTRTLWLLKPPAERRFVHQERFCELLQSDVWRPAEARPVG